VDLPKSADVVVVGGGINGTSIAFHLAKRGVGVTLVEKDFIAAGPSGRSSGIIRQHYSNAATARMALHSLRVWQNFDEVVGGDAGFKQTGFLVCVREEHLEGLRANIAFQQSIGINTRLVWADELKELEPHISTMDIVAAAHEPESGYADPASAANGFANAAKRLGATISVGTKVVSIQTAEGRVTGVITDKGKIAAGNVVIAAGPWSTRLSRTVGIDLPIISSRHQVCLYRWPAGFRGHMINADFVGGVYLRPETGQQMLVGSVEPEEAKDRVDDPDHFNQNADIDTITRFAERVAHRYPDMQQGTSAGGYAALYDITPDWHPIIDGVPGIAGLYVCAGGSGHCFKLSPAIGDMMAKLVADGKKPGDDVNLFSFDRFARGQLIRGKYEYDILG
jgi:glycine/D-amino acid oxidase-like deaminating enzyme